jgi:hypothetical protein
MTSRTACRWTPTVNSAELRMSSEATCLIQDFPIVLIVFLFLGLGRWGMSAIMISVSRFGISSCSFRHIRYRKYAPRS